MPRWLRMVRGMVGMGLTFAAAIGLLGAVLGLVGLLAGEVTPQGLRWIVARLSVAGGILGVAFSGVLAFAARGRSFDRLSLPFVAGLGAGVGLLYFLLISINGIGVWSLRAAVVNLALLTVIGGGCAAAALLAARTAGRRLAPGVPQEELTGGDDVTAAAPREAGQRERHEAPRVPPHAS